ncbi:MAG TPA: hypothetical protein VG821_11060 [Rhizomicrobium sp.]|jgi:hypothetical protein|nr:hypothetical protein [Rhizomicrobium sp.]
MTMILDWLGGKAAGLCAILLAAALVWQTAQIDGWPILGGGYRAQVAGLQQQIAARELAQAKAQATALMARQKIVDAADNQARAHAISDQAIQSQIQTVIREVPKRVDAKSDLCPVPWGVVRLLDAAASGAGPADVAAAIAPGQPDDAASDVKLSEIVALQAANLGAARQNASQLTHLEQAVTP